MKKKLAVITSTRADFGLLLPVIQKLSLCNEIETFVIATGSHLKKEQGQTLCELEMHKIKVAAKLDILQYENTKLGNAKSAGLATTLFAECFAQNNIDAVLLLGDRFEILAAAFAASMLSIPILHISGGEVTKGAQDDAFRHCITKLAVLHFASCEQYKQRIIQLGEPPQSVIVTGALGDENIRSMALLSKLQLQNELGISLENSYALVTFHPETNNENDIEQELNSFLSALERVNELTHICTKANSDAGGDFINNRLEKYAKSNTNFHLFSSLGVLKYLSAMKYASVVIGNSSSGIVEAPSFAVPVVNVGNRQDGRIMAQNIITVKNETVLLEKAIKTAISKGFAVKCKDVQSPFYKENTSKIIAEQTVSFLQHYKNEPKTFYDL